jgi:hypothetical protein
MLPLLLLPPPPPAANVQRHQRGDHNPLRSAGGHFIAEPIVAVLLLLLHLILLLLRPRPRAIFFDGVELPALLGSPAFRQTD